MTGLKQEYDKLNNLEKTRLRLLFRNKFGKKEQLSKPRFYHLLNHPNEMTGDRLKFMAEYFRVSIDQLLSEI